MCRSVPQIAEEVILIRASVARSSSGSSTRSTVSSRVFWKTTACTGRPLSAMRYSPDSNLNEMASRTR